MLKNSLLLLAGIALGTGAAQAGHYFGKMKGAYHHPMLATTAWYHHHVHPHASYRAMLYAMHHGDNSLKGAPIEQANSKSVAADIVETATAAGSFKTLVKAVQEAGLVETLKGKGPFTVFAPTDEAFAQLPEGALERLLADKEELSKVLTYHVVPGKIMAEDLIGKDSIDTVEGTPLPTASLDFSQADVETSNGVIHIINKVLIPNA